MDYFEPIHEVVTESDVTVTTFTGQVPRHGEAVWTSDGAWKVVEVCWHLRPPQRSTAVVYVVPLRDDSTPDKPVRAAGRT